MQTRLSSFASCPVPYYLTASLTSLPSLLSSSSTSKTVFFNLNSMHQGCPSAYIEPIHIKRQCGRDFFQAQILPGRVSWCFRSPKLRQQQNMSLSESASDKKRVLELNDEGHDGGCTRSGPGPIRKLYEVCCRTLDVIVHHYVKRTDVPVQNTIDIRCIYGRLVRFDDVPLHLGNFDDSLKSDKDLRDDVINRLRCLGHTLRKGMSIAISPTSHSISTILS